MELKYFFPLRGSEQKIIPDKLSQQIFFYKNNCFKAYKSAFIKKILLISEKKKLFSIKFADRKVVSQIAISHFELNGCHLKNINNQVTSMLETEKNVQNNFLTEMVFPNTFPTICCKIVGN